MAYARNLDEIRALIAAHKRWDVTFGVVGVLALMVGVLTFAALFGQMLIEGAPRLSWDFFTNFPSRKPDQAGILSAWVGSILVMLVTAGTAVPLADPTDPAPAWPNDPSPQHIALPVVVSAHV